MNAKLVCINLNSSRDGLEFPLADLPVVVGRGNEATIRLDDRWMSRRHCEIDKRKGVLVVTDLESKHGTLVNGRPVTQAVLMPGDKLSVGTTILVATYDAPSAAVVALEPETCAS